MSEQQNEGRSYGPIGDFSAVIISVLVSTAISAAATGVSLLLAGRKKNPTTPFDDRATTLSQRGAIIPNLYGRRRIGYCFAWAGERKSTSDRGLRTYYESGWHILCVGPCDALHGIYENGKPIFTRRLTPAEMPSGMKVTVDKHGDFYIYWGECDQPENKAFAKTGTNKDGQPAYPGVKSRWPGVCYIHWVHKKLGYTPQWPRLEYEIERRGASNTETLAAPNWIDMTTEANRITNTTVYVDAAFPAGTYTATYTEGACRWGTDFKWSVQNPVSKKYGFWIVNAKGTPIKLMPGDGKQYAGQAGAEAGNAGKSMTFHWPGGALGVKMLAAVYKDNVAGAPNPTWTITGPNGTHVVEAVVQQNVTQYGSADDGMNPVHVIWQILTGPHPYGMAMPVDCLDVDSFEACAAALAAERLPVNCGGDPAIDGRTHLGDVMADAGLTLSQVGDKLRLVLIRPDFLPRVTIPADAIVDGRPATTRTHGDSTPDRTTFYIKDRVRNYKANDHIGSGDHDALGVINGRPRTVQVEIRTVTDVKTGAKVAGRRALDVGAEIGKFKFTVLRNADDLYPGQPISIEGVGDSRVVLVRPGVVNEGTEITAVIDQYGRIADDSAAVGDYVEGFGFNGPDAMVAAVQAPTDLAPTSALTYITVLRVRDSADVFSAGVMISADDANYIDLGDTSYCTGGTLNSPIAAGDVLDDSPDPIGPTITVAGPDFADLVEDLTDRDREYDAGRQLVYIGGEWFKLRRATAVSGGFRLDGLTRAQFGTEAADHAENADVFIVKRELLTFFTHPLLTSGDTIFVKAQPMDGGGYPAIELDALPALPIEIA